MEETSVVEDENTRIRRFQELDKSALPPDGGPGFNRLIFSGSPYLLQHAENPVDWYPWGEEAFARARSEDKPIFLSIGYATCHWCHVMAHESFVDREVAETLNRSFVAIKVDREERPDVDEQYMTAAQLMGVGGGWPLNVIMDQDRRPFFIATYLPRTRRRGMVGIIDLLRQIASLWETKREEIARHGADVVAALNQLTSQPGVAELPGSEVREKAYGQLREIYDQKWGGFGTAPKFPMPLYLSFLLHYSRRTGRQEAWEMAEHTLRTMRRGGIYDQLGFGFHRYSVDHQWLVPHFEKMLYDQALLALCYLEAYQVKPDDFFRGVAAEIFTYLVRDMTAPAGGFYAALDADSEGREGVYYIWTRDEVKAVLGREAGERFCRLFGVTEEGNFEGRNILSLPLELPEFAAKEPVPVSALTAEVADWRQRLLQARSRRVKPLRDEKILTAWNGLVIAALARGYAVTGEVSYRLAADRAVTFISERLASSTGRLLRLRHGEDGGIPGFLEDYAFFAWGLLELYEATLETAYLTEALRLTGEMLSLFRDTAGGGLFESGSDVETVLVKSRGGPDGVIPSGSSVALRNILKLGRITGDELLLGQGEAILRSYMGKVAQQPASYLVFLSAWDDFQGPLVEITLAGDQRAPEAAAMLRAIGRRYLPGLVLRHTSDAAYPAPEGRPTAYVCAAGACRPPVMAREDLERLLDGLGANL